jgi:adenine-specific DNA-methyltransferase
MEKVNLQSTDMVDENIKRIGELFPNCLTEVKDENGRPQVSIDFDQLRQELSKVIVEGPVERYQFTWPDKRNAIRLANAPTSDTLRPVRNDENTPTGEDSEGNPYCSTGSVNFDTTKNLYIEGDNLQVLKLLREDYLGKIKMIYIDPPYNTGNDFVYDDDFSQSSDEYIHNSGQTDENGNRLVANTESNGRFHTDWLNMIYPRMKVAKDLLSDDGVIFISIDDNEQRNLKYLCDEIFGEANFIASIIRNTNSTKNQTLFVSVSHEYCLVYARNIETLKIKHAENKWSVPKNNTDEYIKKVHQLQKEGLTNDEITEELKTLTKYPRFIDFTNYWYFDERGLYRKGDLGGVKNGNLTPLFNPLTGKNDPVPPGGYRYNSEKLEELIKENRIHFHTDGSLPTIKRYLHENKEQRPKSIMSDDQRPDYKLLQDFGLPFDNPKQLAFMKRIVGIVDNDSIILDFFSGSATTAHAVIQLNAEDGGKRKFIMVQLPEVTDVKSEAHKAGYKNICEIGKERIRRAGKKITEEHPEAKDLDIGFRVLKLDTSNMEDVQLTPKQYTQASLFADNLKPGRTEEDLLFQTMLRLGIDLSAKIETFNSHGKKVFNVNDNYLLTCFDTDVNESAIEEIAKRQPIYFVMRDASLASDNVRDNIDQLWKHYNPGREKDLIII